ncbi:MAG: GGDEF domain-containing protein [Thermoleophilia bacterium]
MSESALVRLRLQRRLGRGADVRAAVDPWAAEAWLGRGPWDVVAWVAPRHERLARSLLTVPGAPASLLVLPAGASAAAVADALSAGFADVVREDAAQPELVARALAVGRRAAAAGALADSAGAFRELAQGSRDLLMRIGPDGTVLFASAAAAEMLGIPPAGMGGRAAITLCHPDEREALQAALEGDRGDGGAPLAHRLAARGGGWTWVETTVRSVRDPAGRLMEAHTDSRDITERMRGEGERAALARVTAAVAGNGDLAAITSLAAREAAVLTGAESAAAIRFHGDEGLVIGAAGPAYRTGDRVPLAVTSSRTTVVPVTPAGRPWGVLAVRDGGVRGSAARLRPLGDLVALAVANAASRDRLLALATTDALTGLANRRVFHERLDAECARADRAGTPLALVLIDLDHFKSVNDTHGHQVGDEVLREVSRRLRARSRREDVVARFGGEELAWLLPGADLAAAHEAAERLREDIRGTPIGVAGIRTASLGVAEHGHDGPGGLVRRADLGLYRAKASGRDATAVAPADGVRAARSG